ncbi:hypothetical protein [Robiginitalea sp. SC105]|uniref:hypothetical protein n=1 Tax=Robiginitalea sp. SC105 TaxID=2762332 RepID=UPI00163AC5A8|nr:hypothetical protein [Robiginitalea sp. SC105]MBC2840053.1 hypothetical protein [Robiginitalea sp. SC105]
MKSRIRIFATLALVGSLLIQSCSKPDTGYPDQETFIRFTIDGTEYFFENLTTSRYADKSNSNGTARIYPEANSARIYPENTPITLYLPLNVTKGAHEVALDGKPTEYRVAFSTGREGVETDFAHEGRIIIFHVSDQYVEGTFIAHVTSSVSKEEVTLADGRFRAHFD